MKKIVLLLSLLSCSLTTATAQSALISPGSIGVPNVANNPTCNTAAKGNQVYNTTANKMYFCNGISWIDMTVGGFTLPYSGSGSAVNPSHLFSLTNNGNANTLYAENTGSGRAIYGKSISGIAIRSETTNGIGVYSTSTNHYGIYGYSNNSFGVVAESGDSYALTATSFGSQYSAYLTGRAIVSSRLAIGPISYANVEARLHIKGLNTGDWGQHIRMEDKDSQDYGDILYDGGGMKFRTFRVGDEFIFRNSANTTIATIGSDIYANKDVKVARYVTVQNNYGIVRSHNSTQLKVVRTTIPLAASGLGIGAYIDSGDFIYGSNFSSAPIVSVGQINEGSSSGEWYKVIIVPFDVTATTCKFRLFNAANTAINFTANWSLSIVGPE